MSTVTTPGRRRSVPVRTMLAVVGSVLVAVVGIEILLRLRHVVVQVGVSAFFAIVLHPPVDFAVRKLRLKRSLAAIVMFFAGLALVASLGYLFARPLVDQANVAVDNFPHYVADAKAGRGAIGHLVKRYQLDSYVNRNQGNFKNALKAAEKPAVQLAKGFLGTLAAVATIVVMTFLLLIEGPRMLRGALATLSPPNQEKAGIVISDVVRAIAGYMFGVVLTSVLAGGVAYIALWLLGVPFRGVLAMWVGFAALIPLIGVVIGLLPVAAVAFIHSTPAGIAAVVILLCYHLVENRTLHKWINARTIALSPLAVAVSVLTGFKLLGILGALLAIPTAGVVHVALRDLWALRQRGSTESPAQPTKPAQPAQPAQTSPG